ncbi:MAG: sodium:calcium antiporter, partial [Lachnospiraceae bacterium]|nr:sodium:calcium antiporter [Lachnospiraceae bacterium]
RKNEMDMAVGNVVGSNVFNILLILGTAATISPVALLTENIIDIGILVAASLLLMLFSSSSKKIDRKEGAIMLIAYAIFLGYIIARAYL